MLETKGKPVLFESDIALIVSQSPTRPLCRLHIFPSEKNKCYTNGNAKEGHIFPEVRDMCVLYQLYGETCEYS